MDEKNNQSLTLDDIVNQLTKPSIIRGQGQETIGRSPVVPPSVPSPSRPPVSGDFKLPSLGGEIKPQPSPGTVPAPEASKNSNISLSIRTMAQDIERLKRGQGPAPIELKKSIPSIQQQTPSQAPVETQVPSQPISVAPVQPAIPRPTLPPRPAARPLPPSPSISTQQSPTQPLPETRKESPDGKSPVEYVPEHYHREELVSKPEDLLPEYPGAPVPKKIVKPVPENLQYGVIARIIGSGMTAGITITIIIAIAAYLLLSFFIFNGDDLVLPSPTPTSSSQATQTPEFNELESIFRNVSSVNFSLPVNEVEAVGDLGSFIKDTDINKNEFKKINFILPESQVSPITFTDLMNRLAVSYPPILKEAIRENNMTFMYGQGEILGETSSLPDPGLANKKVVLIVEVKDITRTIEILRGWEATMSQDLSNLFNIDPYKAVGLEFKDNEYLGVSIRYKNFPIPDRSIDYAVVRSLVGRQYLVITNSRESMYSPIEKITGL